MSEKTETPDTNIEGGRYFDSPEEKEIERLAEELYKAKRVENILLDFINREMGMTGSGPRIQKLVQEIKNVEVAQDEPSLKKVKP